jgi:colicin import membrane protein
MWKNKKLPIILSIGLHVIIFSLLFLKLPHPKPAVNNNVNIVQAVVVSENQMQQNTPPAPPPKSLVPTLPENTIQHIEQVTLKQRDVPKTEVVKTLPKVDPVPPKDNPPVEEAKPVENTPVEEELPKINDQKLALAKQKLIEEKKKEKQKKEKEIKQQEQALAKQRREEEATRLQKEIASESTVAKAEKAQEEAKPAEETTEDEATNNDTTSEKKESTPTSASASQPGEIDKYKQMIVQNISRKWIMPETEDKNLACQLLVHLGPGGIVLSVDVLKESGDENLDRSARNAIMKASPLPVPENLDLFDNFRALRLTFRPQGIISG